MEIEVLMKCNEIFQRLGWEVSREEKIDCYNYRFDLILRYNGKVYGYAEVVDKNNIQEKAKVLNTAIKSFLNEHKPPVFFITNGFAFDLYISGELYGCLTVPPTPEEVELLFGGDTNE